MRQQLNALATAGLNFLSRLFTAQSANKLDLSPEQQELARHMMVFGQYLTAQSKGRFSIGPVTSKKNGHAIAAMTYDNGRPLRPISASFSKEGQPQFLVVPARGVAGALKYFTMDESLQCAAALVQISRGVKSPETMLS